MIAAGIAAALLSIVAYGKYEREQTRKMCIEIRSIAGNAKAKLIDFKRMKDEELIYETEIVLAKAKAMRSDCFARGF